MSRKLSAIMVGIIILVGVVASVAFHKQGQTTQEDYLVKEGVNDSPTSEVVQNSSDEDEENKEEESASLEDANDKKEQSSNETETSTNETQTSNKSNQSNQSVAADTDKRESDVAKEESDQVANESSKVVDATDTNRDVVPAVPKSRADSGPNSDSVAANNSNQRTQEPSESVNQRQETPPTSETNSSGSYLAEVEQLIYQKVNNERANAGLSALSNSTTMQKYARIKSADMGDRGYFAHEDPNGDLITTAMKQSGVSYSAWGENIAYIGGVNGAEALAEQFMANWMNSPGHRANILSTDYDSVGIGVYQIGNTVYATQEFMR